MGLLAVLDFLFVNHACHSIITRGASVQLVFGFEVCYISVEAEFKILKITPTPSPLIKNSRIYKCKNVFHYTS